MEVIVNGARARATTYRASRIDPIRVPWHWYKDLVLAGAMEHGLPWFYTRAIRQTPARRDPNDLRRAKGEAILTQR